MAINFKVVKYFLLFALVAFALPHKAHAVNCTGTYTVAEAETMPDLTCGTASFNSKSGSYDLNGGGTFNGTWAVGCEENYRNNGPYVDVTFDSYYYGPFTVGTHTSSIQFVCDTYYNNYGNGPFDLVYTVNSSITITP